MTQEMENRPLPGVNREKGFSSHSSTTARRIRPCRNIRLRRNWPGKDRHERHSHDDLYTMTQRKKDASIVTHKEKAPELRKIVSGLNLQCSELEVPGNDTVIRFTFKITDEELGRLLQLVPRDIFAHQEIIGGLPK